MLNPALEAPHASEDLFPSGPWRGFYVYSGASASSGRHRMDLELRFEGGRVDGGGVDDLGAFRITGRYDAETLEVTWSKHYLGAHEVLYRGFREGKGIWGTWRIPNFGTGGFRIWPAGLAADEEATTAASESAQQEREQELVLVPLRKPAQK